MSRRSRRPPTVAVVGLGLVGGSLAKALTRAGWRVIGVDAAPVRRRARRAGAVAMTSAGIEKVLHPGMLVVLAAPPRANVALLRRIARRGSRGIVVTDVGSVKEGICAEARRLQLRNFVGGHPMAGSASSGFGSSSVELFRGRPWILVRGASKKALTAVRRLVRAAGGQPVMLADPRRHDRALAFLSHLPQLVSWALQDAAAKDPVAGRHMNLAGQGFRDMTRLASSPRPLWREILLENRAQVSRALKAFDRALGRRRGSPA